MPVDVLLFGAHPDDVEWGAGGIALLLRDSGISFAIVDMTNGEMGSRGTLEQRQAEAVAAAEFLGARARESLNLPDCGLLILLKIGDSSPAPSGGIVRSSCLLPIGKTAIRITRPRDSSSGTPNSIAH